MTKLMVEHRTWWGGLRWAEYRFQEFHGGYLIASHLHIYAAPKQPVACLRNVVSWMVAQPTTCSVRVVSVAHPEALRKIQAIKTLRVYFQLGLKEARELIETPTPFFVAEGMQPAEATRLSSDLSACGYQAEVLHAD